MPAAALVAPLGPGMLDQDAPDRLSGDAEEVSPAFPLWVAAIEKTQIRLIGQCRRLQCVARPLALEVAGRDGSHLVVDQRHQPVQGAAVSVSQGIE